MIGESHPRLGGERYVAGAGRFVDDVRVPGMLHAAVLRSPHAHARLVSVDARHAREMPGVHAVLTAADVPAAAIIPNRVPAPAGTERYLQPAIARTVVRYVGEPVALVVADDPYVARDALERIDTVYEPLPACPSVAEALAPGAPRLFAGTDTNNVATITMRVGDAGAALAGAAVVIRERFHYPRQTAAALETRGLVAVPPDPRGGELHLIGSTKCIHINRTILAPIFGLPPGALRLTEVDVGGGFGVRGELYPEDVLVPLAALKLGRPVKWIESRRENLMAANHAREVAYEVEIGLDREGRILGLRAVIHADIGAYVRTAALVPAEFGASLLPGPYRVPSYACDLWSVVTNKTPAGTLRSPGRPECNFVRERLMDRAAARLGLDPAEIRRRNLIRPDEMPYDSGTRSFGVNTVYDSGDFPALFDELLRRLDYDRARAEQAAMNARPSGPRRGIGLAVYVEKTGLGPFETTQVEARPDGRFVVDTGASSMGPGLETVLAQILGECLGQPTARFDVRHADTAAVESGVGTYGSRGTVTAGNAAALAAAKLVAEARQRAAARWGVAEAEVAYAHGTLAAGGRRVTLAELAAERRLAAGASFEVPKVTYAGCACAVVLDVDPETGALALKRVVVGADVGRAVNPALVDAQLVGGVAFGIGNTLYESLVYDGGGQLVSGTLMDYALPYAADVPPVDGFYQEVRATTNPLGLRGLGECGNPGLGGAIANAVCDALGRPELALTALPITPSRIRTATEPPRPMMRAADRLEVLVLVDNSTDSLSTTPKHVVPEWAGLLAAGRLPTLSGEATCRAHHGLSLLLTAWVGDERHTLLFDAGPAGSTLTRNAAILGVDWSEIEAVVLSHGHWDHGGGLLTAIESIARRRSPGKLDCFVHPGMFSQRGLQRADGTMFVQERLPTPERLAGAGASIVNTREAQTAVGGVFYVSGEIPRVTPYEVGLPGHVRRAADGSWEPDPLIMDERFVSVQVRDKGQFVFSACSHAGIVNVLTHARGVFPSVPLYGAMGGLHLSGVTEKIIPDTVGDLRRFGLQALAPGHCTGWRAMSVLAREFGDELIPSAVGKRYVL